MYNLEYLYLCVNSCSHKKIDFIFCVCERLRMKIRNRNIAVTLHSYVLTYTDFQFINIHPLFNQDNTVCIKNSISSTYKIKLKKNKVFLELGSKVAVKGGGLAGLYICKTLIEHDMQPCVFKAGNGLVNQRTTSL